MWLNTHNIHKYIVYTSMSLRIILTLALANSEGSVDLLVAIWLHLRHRVPTLAWNSND